MPPRSRPSAPRSTRGRLPLALLPLLAACAGAGRVAPAPASAPIDGAVAAATFDSVWAIVGRTYHDPTMRGVDWAAARGELRPRAERAATTAELRATVDRLLARLGESHLSLVPREAVVGAPDAAGAERAGAPGAAGLALRVVEGALAVTRVAPDGPAARAGVRPGWTLVEVDGAAASAALAPLGDPRLDRAARRALATRIARSAELRFDGVAGDTVAATFADAGGRRARVRLARRVAPGAVVRFGALPPQLAHLEHERQATAGGCVGVVRFGVWMTPIVAPLGRAMHDLRDCAGVVVDLRGNPGGVAGLVSAAGGWLLDSAVTLGTMRARGTTLRLAAVPRRVTDDGAPTRPFAGRVAIVVDAHSASTTEFFAGGLQAVGRARVFGDTTSGMALPAAMAWLPNGDALMHPLADYVDAAGRRLEGRGVAPDVVVPQTLAALRAGRDAPLDAAVAWAAGTATARATP